jgi:hypothetical protein
MSYRSAIKNNKTKKKKTLLIFIFLPLDMDPDPQSHGIRIHRPAVETGYRI